MLLTILCVTRYQPHATRFLTALDDLAAHLDCEYVEYDGGRLGALVRFSWSGGEIAASTGASIDRSGETGGYGALHALYR